ncbi:hypothetical protein ACU4GH_34095 [Bradyrhizobium betae]
MAIVDFDVHHGNGTEAAFIDEPRVLMCSIFQHPFYPYSGSGTVAANMVNIPLPAYTNGLTVREVVETIWLPRLEAFQPEMLFISAGFDAHREDDLGTDWAWSRADYAWITKQLMQVARTHAKGRIVGCLRAATTSTRWAAAWWRTSRRWRSFAAIDDDESLMTFEKVIKTSLKNRSSHVGLPYTSASFKQKETATA